MKLESCSRVEAVRALKSSNDDMVGAVVQLQNKSLREHKIDNFDDSVIDTYSDGFF